MTLHRAVCTDCAWSREGEDLVDVSDKMERHQRKEKHHVDLNKAVTTDGGKEIKPIELTDGAKIADFVDIADERSRGGQILDEPQDVDLRLVELSASFLDPDGILRTFSITSDGFDPEDYNHDTDDDPELVSDGGTTTRDSQFKNKQAFYDRVSSELEPDVGPVDGDECEGNCDEDAVYRVPWPHVGGDVAYCGYHLATYRHDHPEIWDRIRSGPFPDPDDHIEIGNRFVSLNEIPEKIRDETFRRVCLDHEGFALFESATPDDGHVTYIRVDNRLEEFERNTVRKEISGELLGWYRQTIGWHQVDPDVQEALFG